MFFMGFARQNTGIVIYSFLILFLELILIRLIGTEVRIFAYFQNLILLVIFIGSGIGMLVKKELPIYLSLISLSFVTMILASGSLLNLSNILAPIHESYTWYSSPTPPNLLLILFGLIITTLFLLLVAVIFMPLGQQLGKSLVKNTNINTAYSVNLVFSLLGIWCFDLASMFSVSPYYSLLFCVVVLALLTAQNLETSNKKLFYLIVIIPFLFVTIYNYKNKKVFWSPYQKLQLVDIAFPEPTPAGPTLLVNNVGYMGLLNLDATHYQKVEKYIVDKAADKNILSNYKYLNQYDLPVFLNPTPENVLVIGAGSGNDVVGALKTTANKIDAVEIDPNIYEIAKKYHPQKPYDDKRVKININDGRQFIKNTKTKYDLVIMGLADSHTLNSSLTNVQLDNFLYTSNALSDIKNILTDKGVLFLAFEIPTRFVGAKLEQSIKTVFDGNYFAFTLKTDPIYFGWSSYYFVAAKNEQALFAYTKNNPDLKTFMDNRKVSFVAPAKALTDDYPYLYLDKPRIPRLHLIISAILLLTLFFGIKSTSKLTTFRYDSLLLGAGFLLYEFQNISKSAVIYGNTWQTNAFIISAILILILCANLIDKKVKININLLYLFLGAAFIYEFMLNPNNFLTATPAIKFFVVPLLLNLPLLFSGLIFVQLLTKSTNKNDFFAANLLGSALGGILSYLSYIYGLKSLLFISFGTYLASFMILKIKNKMYS